MGLGPHRDCGGCGAPVLRRSLEAGRLQVDLDELGQHGRRLPEEVRQESARLGVDHDPTCDAQRVCDLGDTERDRDRQGRKPEPRLAGEHIHTRHRDDRFLRCSEDAIAGAAEVREAFHLFVAREVFDREPHRTAGADRLALLARGPALLGARVGRKALQFRESANDVWGSPARGFHCGSDIGEATLKIAQRLPKRVDLARELASVAALRMSRRQPILLQPLAMVDQESR